MATSYFHWVPYFQGKLLTYYEYFALVGSTAVIIMALISYSGYLLLKKNPKRLKPKSDIEPVVETPNGIRQKLQAILYNMTFIFLSLVPLICSATTVIPTIGGIFGMMLILSIKVITNNHRAFLKETEKTVGKMDWCVTLRRSMNFNKRTIKKQLILVAIFSILLPLFAHRTCLCFYNDEIGYYNHALGFGINTMFTRLFQLNKACPPGPPCHLYTTLPQDSITAVFVNLHTHIDVTNVTVHYQQIDTYNSSEEYSVQANTYEYHGLDWNDQRNVHSALIMGLKPSTKYLIRVFYNNRFWTNAIYKTLSDDPKVPVRMINAGDSGYTRPAIVLTKIIATLKPDVFFIGGDIAYDDNMPACAYTWDYYLKLYGSLTSTIGYMMPLVLTVGNHDVGLNEMPGINITINNYGPAYLLYFPQHFDRNGNFQIMKTIPPINRRRTFFYHTFSNFVYLSLDSGYVNTFNGFQKDFMIDTLKQNPKKLKFVNYHVPMYSGCKDFDIDPQTFVYGLFHWIPYFDKYRVMAVYENHVHSFKRTKPLRGSIPAENGTVYMGDGAFGAITSEFCQPDRSIPIFEKQMNHNNFWLSAVDNQKVEHTAYNNSAIIIDQFVQDVSGYIF